MGFWNKNNNNNNNNIIKTFDDFSKMIDNVDFKDVVEKLNIMYEIKKKYPEFEPLCEKVQAIRKGIEIFTTSMEAIFKTIIEIENYDPDIQHSELSRMLQQVTNKVGALESNIIPRAEEAFSELGELLTKLKNEKSLAYAFFFISAGLFLLISVLSVILIYFAPTFVFTTVPLLKLSTCFWVPFGIKLLFRPWKTMESFTVSARENLKELKTQISNLNVECKRYDYIPDEPTEDRIKAAVKIAEKCIPILSDIRISATKLI